MNFDSLPSPALHEAYFPCDLVNLLIDDTFVDCGSFDGDTIRTLLRSYGDSFKKIVAFEPDPVNFLKLQQFALSLPTNIYKRLVLYQMAIGARKGIVNFGATGTAASAIGSGNISVDCVLLDENSNKRNVDVHKNGYRGL